MSKISTYPILVIFLFVTLIGVEGSLFGQNASVENNLIIDSLKLALKTTQHDTSRVSIYLKLGKRLSLKNPDTAIVLWQKAQFLSEKNLTKDGFLNNYYLKQLAKALNNIGTVYNDQGNAQKALEYGLKSLKIRQEIGDKKGLISSLNNIAGVYKSLGDISKALDYYLKGIRISEELEDKKGIAMSLNNIGIIYREQGDISKSLEYWLKSLKIREELKDKYGIANSLHNIGVIYSEQGDIPKGLECWYKSIKIKEEIGDKMGMTTSLNSIGIIYSQQGNNSKALEYYRKNLTIQEEIDDKVGIANSLANIGQVYVNQDNLKESLSYGVRALAVGKELGYPENIKNAANLLEQIFQKQNKYKEAFEMYELEIKMRDSINNQETQKATIKKQLQYTYEKKELETKAEQDKKDAIAKAELNQKENERNYFIAGFGLVLMLALFIFRGYKQKQKANAIILEQKNLVDEKQKEILDSIHYAKRIQTALITSEKYIEKELNKLYKFN